jgi:hypothetical protein
LNLTADFQNNYAQANIPFTSGSSGFIEYYLAADDTTEGGGDSFVIATESDGAGATVASNVFFNGGNIMATQSNGGGGISYINMGAVDNFTWVHIIIEYEITTDTLSVWRDGVNYIDAQNFQYDNDFAADELDLLEVSSWRDNYPNTSFYIDAIGYTQDSFYSRGDNYFPLRNQTGYLEVDRYDWTLYGIDQAYVHTADVIDPQGWTTTNPQDQLHWTHSFGNGRDRDIYWFAVGNLGVYTTLLEKDFNQLGDNFEYYELEWKIYPNQLENNNAHFGISINSNDATLLSEIRILTDKSINEATVWYYDGSYHELTTPLHHLEEGKYYIFALSWVSGHEFGKLDFYEDDVFIATYWIDFLDGGTGLEVIEFKQIAQAAAGDVDLIMMDDFKIDSNGNSLYNDGFGYIQVDMNLPAETWHFQQRNNGFINAYGNISVGGCETIYYNPDVSDFGLGESNVFINNTLTHINFYDSSSGDGLTDPHLVFYLQDENIIFENLSAAKVDGVALTQGSNTYWMIYTHSGITSTSYFYVSGSRILFELYVDDNDPEWILASFDIDNISCENYSISVATNMDGQSEGFAQINFTDATSQFLEFKPYANTITQILPQTKVITTINFLITDNDALDDDYTSGYISTITLIYYPELSSSIVITNIISMIVPLIIMILPTFAIYTRYGRKTILPVFILMTILCFATELIPTWIFFVIMFCAAAFVFMERRGRDD